MCERERESVTLFWPFVLNVRATAALLVLHTALLVFREPHLALRALCACYSCFTCIAYCFTCLTHCCTFRFVNLFWPFLLSGWNWFDCMSCFTLLTRAALFVLRLLQELLYLYVCKRCFTLLTRAALLVLILLLYFTDESCFTCNTFAALLY